MHLLATATARQPELGEHASAQLGKGSFERTWPDEGTSVPASLYQYELSPVFR
jgi:hypothetical protein